MKGPRSEGAAVALRVGLLAATLFAFFLGLELLGVGFRLLGRGFAEMLMQQTANPFVGLFVGIIATTVLQSSSATTSMTVGLVGAGALGIEGAIPIIMGANIGTSVTNSLVSLAHVTRREEFGRAFAGATIHDVFNWMTVLLLFPLELSTGFLARTSHALAGVVADVGGLQLLDPVKIVVRPVALRIAGLTGDSGWMTLIAGFLLLFAALKILVDLLKALMSHRAEQLLHRTLFRSPLAAVLAGIGMTVMVQSSTITTSAIVPLVAAGVVRLDQLFPFTIGANVGTTITAMLAALATGSAEAVTVAFSHLVFNLSGALILYVPPPIRAVPLAIARGMGRLAVRNRLFAAAYVLVLFFALPLALLFFSGALGPRAAPEPAPPAPHARAAAAPPIAALYWSQNEREAGHVL